jgi:hypothetical protein
MALAPRLGKQRRPERARMAEPPRRFPPPWHARRHAWRLCRPGRQWASSRDNEADGLVIRNVVHLLEYLPPCASHTRPRCVLVHREKARSPSSRHPHHSERPTRRRRWRAPPVRSKKRDIPMARRYRVDAKAYGVRRATVRSIGLCTPDVRPYRLAPACIAMQDRKITLGVHDTINPIKNP